MPEDSVSVTGTKNSFRVTVNVQTLECPRPVFKHILNVVQDGAQHCRGSLRFDNISDNARATKSNRNPNVDYDMNFISLMELSKHRILYFIMLCQLTR